MRQGLQTPAEVLIGVLTLSAIHVGLSGHARGSGDALELYLHASKAHRATVEAWGIYSYSFEYLSHEKSESCDIRRAIWTRGTALSDGRRVRVSLVGSFPQASGENIEKQLELLDDGRTVFRTYPQGDGVETYEYSAEHSPADKAYSVAFSTFQDPFKLSQMLVGRFTLADLESAVRGGELTVKEQSDGTITIVAPLYSIQIDPAWDFLVTEIVELTADGSPYITTRNTYLREESGTPVLSSMEVVRFESGRSCEVTKRLWLLDKQNIALRASEVADQFHKQSIYSKLPDGALISREDPRGPLLPLRLEGGVEKEAREYISVDQALPLPEPEAPRDYNPRKAFLIIAGGALLGIVTIASVRAILRGGGESSDRLHASDRWPGELIFCSSLFPI